ncbi:AfsR/SARP family transcriptional regulator [Nonomuraea sp. NPDC046802]|uniref:AfsR/SARP family transcriptional regulator n=1 Tax=Nonomuraea sp. NPDC046802 TaxID=3154919 RepID=UPI0033F6F154
MSTGSRFSLLGPVRAWRGAAELDLGAPQQRAVLAFLLLREGDVASAEEIADALWAGQAPGSALAVVRTYICRLRRVVSAASDDEQVIRSAGGGYAITAGTEDVDWNAFREKVREARALRANPAEAADLLRNALRLWRGTPLGGARGDYVDQERTRLLQRRVAVLEEQVALDLELGRHAEVIEELTAVIAAEPMRERLRELQMIALYRSGRQAEALSAYDEVRRLLAAELGIDPGVGLRDLYVRILRADPGLATPAPARRPPAVPPGFVGRDAELADTQDMLRPAGWTPVVAITGLGGAGKTAVGFRSRVHVCPGLSGICAEDCEAPACPYSSSLRCSCSVLACATVRSRHGRRAGADH